METLKRIDAIFDIERGINGLTAEQRLRAPREQSAGLLAGLESWMRAERAKLSRHADVAKAIDSMLTRWPAFTRFLDDGRICLANIAAERALRGLPLGTKSWLFAGSERGAERAAVMYTLIQTCLCRSRHRQVYADRRTMPNGSGSNPSLGRNRAASNGLHLTAIRHSLSSTARLGRRADGRLVESGLASRVDTA